MHQSAMANCKAFFDCYSTVFEQNQSVRVIDVGSQDVNGSLRSVTPGNYEYIGLDFCKAKGVDIVLESPYHFPLDDQSVDIVLSSSCFEHSEFFWLVFLEIMRCLKPHGLFWFNVPSSGSFHRYPVDCWRFYPDSGLALVNWAKRNKINACLLESFTHLGGMWQDFNAVFLKEESLHERYTQRILDTKNDFENGYVFSKDSIYPQDSIRRFVKERQDFRFRESAVKKFQDRLKGLADVLQSHDVADAKIAAIEELFRPELARSGALTRA